MLIDLVSISYFLGPGTLSRCYGEITACAGAAWESSEQIRVRRWRGVNYSSVFYVDPGAVSYLQGSSISSLSWPSNLLQTFDGVLMFELDSIDEPVMKLTSDEYLARFWTRFITYPNKCDISEVHGIQRVATIVKLKVQLNWKHQTYHGKCLNSAIDWPRTVNVTRSLLNRSIRRSLTAPMTAEIYGNNVSSNIKRSCRLLHQHSDSGVFNSEAVWGSRLVSCLLKHSPTKCQTESLSK